MLSRSWQVWFVYVVFIITLTQCQPRALPMIYNTQSVSVNGNWCLNDCVDGKCVVNLDVIESCTRSDDPAPQYFTTGQRYSDKYKCTSRCKVLKGSNLPRCFVDYDWNKLDFCNPAPFTEVAYKDFTLEHGPCANDCKPKGDLRSGDSFGKGQCNDISGALRSCYIDKYLYEAVTSLNGHRCNGICDRHNGKPYYWCMYSLKDWDYCALPSFNYRRCHDCVPSLVRQYRETVFKYAERVENDPDFRTVTVSDPNNPIFRYTYNETRMPNGDIVRLPLAVRARVYRAHIRPPNSRGHTAISSAARTNCRRMGMTNVDAVGHLISYKMGGPSDFYNFVPMTQAINIGTLQGSVYAPSVWTATEREDAQFVENDAGWLNIVVVLQYDPNHPRYPYRPFRIGWGQIGHTFSGDQALSCNNYWYNNDPDAEDPECFD